MNLSVTGVLLALVTGLLGVILMLNIFDTQHADYRAQEAYVRCEKATHDAEFAATFSKPDAALEARKAAACQVLVEKDHARDQQEMRTAQERDDLKRSITRLVAEQPQSTKQGEQK